MNQTEMADLYREIEKIRRRLDQLWLKACQKEPGVPDWKQQEAKRQDLQA